MMIKVISNIFIALALVFTSGCGSGAQLQKDRQTVLKTQQEDKAYQHFLNGALLDFQNHYEKALIEYYQALLYDSVSAQIYKVIARDLMRLGYHESAAHHLSKSHKLNPRDRETLIYLAEANYNIKAYQKSITAYEKLLALDPYNRSAQNNLVFLYTHLKMDQSLLDYYKKMMNYFPGEEKYAIQYALNCIKQNRLEEAQLVLEKIVKDDATQTQALLVLGNLYEAKKDTTSAVRTYRNLLTYDPTNREILNRLYRIYRIKGQWDQIENIYEPIIQQYDNHSQVRMILAETYFFQDKMDEARAVVEPVVKDNNLRPAAFELMGRIAFEQEKYEDAENYFSQLTEEYPENKFGWIFLAVIQNREAQYQNSIDILQNAINFHPDDPDLLSMYGSTLSQMGKDQKAIQPLEKSLQIDKGNISTLTSLAAVYDKLKIWEKSDSLYQIALQENPDNALLLNNYSYSLAQRGLQLDLALELVNRALEQEPENGAYLDTKGWIYYQRGEYEKALKFIHQALETREESPELLDHLGDVYFKINQHQQARSYWQKALEKDPDNPELKRKLQSL